MNNHTETPIIYIESKNTYDEQCFDLISNPDSNSFYYLGEVVEEANAAFIVKAVNNHERLIDVLKLILAEGGIFPDIAERAREAIKEAEL